MSSKHGDPFLRRLAYDVETDPDWKSFLAALSVTEKQPLELLGDFTFSGRAQQFSPATVDAAFRLSCRYRKLRQAAQLLDGMPHPDGHILQFARLLEDGMRSAPLCMHTPTYFAWQRVLRRAWVRVHNSSRVSDEELILIHEVLLGQGVTLASTMSEAHGHVLLRKLQGEIGDDSISDLLDEDVRHLTAGEATRRDGLLGRTRQLLAERPGVALASLALVGESGDEFSLVCIGPDGRVLADRERLPGTHLIDEAKKFTGFRAPYPWLPFPQVSALQAIARRICAWLADFAPSAKWLLVCVELGLARVPWQALLGRHGCVPVVALIPSFGWLVRHGGLQRGAETNMTTGGIRLPDDETTFASLPSGTRHPGLAELLDSFRRDAGELRRQYRKTMFVLGHGLWDETSKRTTLTTAISPPTAESHLDEVVALARARVVILHACYGGYNVASGLGDLGGLAGICLAARGRLFVGALSQVSPQTAGLLHRHLREAKTDSPLGETYLNAVTEDERVAQYALFGLPWETG